MRRSFVASALVVDLALIALTVLAVPAGATPGGLDRSFNQTGKNSAFAGGGTGYAVAIDHRGRLLVAGYTLTANTNIALARFLPDGHFDPSFGGGDGRVITDLGGTDYAFDVAIDGNGGIVVAGERDTAHSSEFAVLRYGIHGVLDRSFSGDGKAFIDFGRRYQGANAVAVGGSGNIVVGGFASNGTASVWALARLRPDGTLDPSFGSRRQDHHGLSPTNEQIEDLLIGRGGTITAAGFAESSLVPRFAVAQYLIGGRLDPSFGQGGKSLIDVSAGSDIAYGLARQRDGKFVLAGFANNGGGNDWGIVRVGPHGRPDPTLRQRRQGGHGIHRLLRVRLRRGRSVRPARSSSWGGRTSRRAAPKPPTSASRATGSAGSSTTRSASAAGPSPTSAAVRTPLGASGCSPTAGSWWRGRRSSAGSARWPSRATCRHSPFPRRRSGPLLEVGSFGR